MSLPWSGLEGAIPKDVILRHGIACHSKVSPNDLKKKVAVSQ